MVFLAAFAIIIFFAAKLLTSGFYEPESPRASAELSRIDQNIRPIGEVNVAQPGGGAAAPAATEVAAAPAAVDGKQVYSTACFACHGTGAAGAPKSIPKTAISASGSAQNVPNAVKTTSSSIVHSRRTAVTSGYATSCMWSRIKMARRHTYAE